VSVTFEPAETVMTPVLAIVTAPTPDPGETLMPVPATTCVTAPLTLDPPAGAK
jgi:hypothetical protein